MEDKSKQPASFSEAWSDLKASPKGLFIIFFLKILFSLVILITSNSYFSTHCTLFSLNIYLSFI